MIRIVSGYRVKCPCGEQVAPFVVISFDLRTCRIGGCSACKYTGEPRVRPTRLGRWL